MADRSPLGHSRRPIRRAAEERRRLVLAGTHECIQARREADSKGHTELQSRVYLGLAQYYGMDSDIQEKAYHRLSQPGFRDHSERTGAIGGSNQPQVILTVMQFATHHLNINIEQ